MDAPCFDRLTLRFQQLTAGVSRRRLLHGLALGAAASGGDSLSEVAAAKKVHCRGNGGPCRKAGKRCKAGNCLARRWISPANLAQDKLGWHVFDVDGKTGRISSVDQLATISLPAAAHAESTLQCAV